MKGGQKNFPRDDNINGTNFKICQLPDEQAQLQGI